jgi:hypothetical protein
MLLMTCTKCQFEIASDAQFCHHCGASLSPYGSSPEAKKTKRSTGGTIAIAIGITAFGGMLISGWGTAGSPHGLGFYFAKGTEFALLLSVLVPWLRARER